MIAGIKGIGVDIEEVDRFRKECKNKNFIRLIFTKREIDYCERKKESYRSLAGKFCAKEAVIKSLENPVPINCIEVLNSKSGKVEVYINKKRDRKIHCSISHSDTHAVAFAVVTT